MRYGQGPRSLHIVSMRTIFVPSYMIIHQCVSYLLSYSLETKCYIHTDRRMDKAHFYNLLPVYAGELLNMVYGRIVVAMSESNLTSTCNSCARTAKWSDMYLIKSWYNLSENCLQTHLYTQLKVEKTSPCQYLLNAYICNKFPHECSAILQYLSLIS